MDRNRLLDKAKSAAFTDSNAAFLGCLLCNLNFLWSTKVPTAAVDGINFYWNPDWFDSLTPEERKGVLMHELWHIALLHGIRGEKFAEAKRWNVACDILINNRLIKEGYTIPVGGCVDPRFVGDEWLEEKIYEELPSEPEEQSWGTGVFSTDTTQVTVVQNAMATAKFAGNAPGNVEAALKDFLKPKLPWKQLLHKYLLDKVDPDYSWNKPNRRFSNIYLPSLLPQEGRLITIAMFLDTSGSISEEDSKLFVSEVKFVQEVLNPEKLVVVQFDTTIQEVKEYSENTPFSNITLKGFGGTNYECIRQYILKHKPTVSIIFTDLWADPMQDVGRNELIWIVKDNSDDAPQGKTIHVC